MRKVTVVLFFLLTFQFSNAQWVYQSTPLGRIYSDLDFWDSSTGYACGGTPEVIIKTTNGGTNWIISNMTSANYRVLKICVVTANVVYAITNESRFWKTTDGGANWNSLYISTGLEDIQFINVTTGYTIGNSGKIFKTTDAGENWTLLNSGTSYRLSKIQMVDANTGYVLGANPYITIKTTNAGTNWTVLDYQGGTDLCFLNVNTGYKTAGYIYKTSNGGLNWENLYPGNSYQMLCINFTSSLTGYAGASVPGSGRWVFKTVDGGENWTRYGLDTFAAAGDSLPTIKFVDDFTGWVLVDRTIHKTSNGGSTFIGSNTGVVPENFTLSQNYPNPFNPTTVINYQLSKNSFISMNVYDANGRLIKILESGNKPAGNYSTNFSAEGLSSGIYYYSLYSDGILMDTKKAVVIK